MSKILENLWLGNYRDALNDQFINENEINVVVNCTPNLPFHNKIYFKYRIPVNDDLQDNSMTEMFVAMNHLIPILVKHINRGDKILIHCFAGIQRSAILTMGLLTALSFDQYFANGITQESLESYINNIKKYMSDCRPIVFTPGMNFKKSYLMWLQMNYINSK